MQSPAESPSPATNRAPVRAHILVADDEAGIRMLVARTLQRAGYDVSSVVHGGEALALLERQHVDLLITDLVMPEKEGIGTIMSLRRTHPDLPIIAMSGGNPRGPGDFLGIAGMLGARRTLRKPFDCDTLLTAVRELLEGRP